MTVLRIDSSAKEEGSVTQKLLDQIEARIGPADMRRDLGGVAVPQIGGTWLAANFTPPEERTPQHRETLALSDELIAELRAADTILIGLPVYNFSIPGSLKAWIDLVARAGETFRYTEDGPIGLLENKRVIVAYASAGTGFGSEIDHASPYLRHILGFMGITDVTFVYADQQNMKGDEAIETARSQIEELAQAA
ncbi:NAD(P)H-dependent oxidoreductase [uncultured Jannaschia sp.]|uniref:FMN-dependent NADH-azoreductase n=1 Tax=uncultured Jannaschia sp. TaxID=293347 RepID=UPI0026361C19|nr:NAD(P)H-dependent oxidoreductase [uncultured Jannaschia sp.]